ncbi:MAG: hypothetical protein HFG89_00545 [Dorea sp.]|jgi:hypothetical protein|nr:hypothetical protein [Dorea sp.]
MSISTYVQGLKPKTEEYQTKLDIYTACRKINVEHPREIADSFVAKYAKRGLLPSFLKKQLGNMQTITVVSSLRWI